MDGGPQIFYQNIYYVFTAKLRLYPQVYPHIQENQDWRVFFLKTFFKYGEIDANRWSNAP